MQLRSLYGRCRSTPCLPAGRLLGRRAPELDRGVGRRVRADRCRHTRTEASTLRRRGLQKIVLPVPGGAAAGVQTRLADNQFAAAVLSIQRMPDDQSVQIEFGAGHQRCQTGLLVAREIVEQRRLIRFIGRLLSDTLLGGALLRPGNFVELAERRRREEPTSSFV